MTELLLRAELHDMNGRTWKSLVAGLGLLSTWICAASTTEGWIRTFDGGGAGDDEAIAVAAANDIYVAGKMDRGGYTSGFVARYSPSGDRVWLLPIEPFPGQYCNVSNIALVPSGHLFAACACRDSAGVLTIAILKISADGVVLAQVRYSHPDHISDSPRDLCLGSDEGCFVVGRSEARRTGVDCVVIRCDSMGDLLWTSRYDLEESYNDAAAIAVDSADCAYVVGEGIASWRSVGIITKFTAGGDTCWARTAGNPGVTAEFADVAVADSCVYAVGYVSFGRPQSLTVRYRGTGDTVWSRDMPVGLPTAIARDTFGVLHCSSADDSSTAGDMKIIAHDPSGELRWATRIDGPGHLDDFPRDLAVDSNLGVAYVTGYSSGVTTGRDCATVSLDAAGELRWSAIYTGYGEDARDEGNAVCIGRNGDVFVAGYTTSSSTNKDVLLIRYPSSGPGISRTVGNVVVPRRAISVYPSPARLLCRLRAANFDTPPILVIRDASGRIVREFNAKGCRRNNHLWDLTDATGRSVASGVFFVSTGQDGASDAVPIVVVR